MMSVYSKCNVYTLYHGKMQDELSNLADNSVDSIITDPPYELNFMNKVWDNSGVAFQKETWENCLRVLKPGGYLLSFGGSRTYHRIACAIEDAGFEIRDTIMWLYGSGFPKSMNIGLALDKKEGLQGQRGIGGFNVGGIQEQENRKAKLYIGSTTDGSKKEAYTDYKSDIAKKWSGWGTALKPAFEPIIVARKPFAGSLVDNILKNGVGGMNIDECRVGTDTISTHNAPKGTFAGGEYGRCSDTSSYHDHIGRFPANIITDGSDEVSKGFPYSKGACSQNNFSDKPMFRGNSFHTSSTSVLNINNGYREWYNDEGSAMRYFYCAKASKKDRDEGLDDMPITYSAVSNQAQAELKRGNIDFSDENNSTFNKVYVGRNTHPTVKPTSLMQYLVRLVSPKGSTILDPFMGSGSTGKAVMIENAERNAGYKFVGVEMTDEYLPIAEARISYWIKKTIEHEEGNSKEAENNQYSLFDFMRGENNEL